MATVSEAYQDKNFYPHNLPQIIPLDFDAIQTLPESHVWPESDDFQFNDVGQLSVPTIDLEKPDVGNLIGHACETWGAFQVINHGIPLELLHEVESETRRLFSLPSRQKLKALRSPGGATGYGRARISQFFTKYMWHEGFTIMGSPEGHARLLWPHDYRRFCDIMEDYEKKLKELARTLMQIIFDYLAISEEESKRVGSAIGSKAPIQLNSYPYCPDPDRAMGLAPHTDTSLLTILHQNSIKGLQIFKQGVGWILVNPTSGALVVNVGDLLHIISNAKFQSVVHRVVMKEAKQQRLSVAYFHSLASDFDVFPMGLCCGQSPFYRSVSVAEYLGIKANNIDNPLSFVRI
ncbi:gibberellin 3-beta-dioxygenase 1-like isoform X2 [Mercurialis annua]|uniref:gibberellin 3-beta-dioxygenase 1-like isoform X2 n=1 Tax=Mercurialis annua TaxID=3986 RepID=UPI00215F3A94|nr:gibberellin 3-beta-dioxygenase 1-like isoform X2 [Mercurialis annua]